MYIPKLSIVVVVLLVLLASLPMVVVSSADPSSDPADTSEGAPPQRISHLHLQVHGSDKVTLAVRGDHLRIPRFASHDHEGAWHACADDSDHHGPTPDDPAARVSRDDASAADGEDYSSVVSGKVRLKDLRAGKRHPIVDEMAELARSTARTMDDGLQVFFNILEQGQEPGDVWKIMSCAVLIAEQNGGAWTSKEALQLRSFGMFTKEDVLKQLGVIAWPNDCSEPITLDRDSL